MWLLVMFDLPVISEQERKRAAGFRKFLLDEGFEMSQFSVYLKHTHSREKAQAIAKRVTSHVPPAGKVSILFFTDKQFAEIISYYNCTPGKLKKNPDQYTLL
jgi:CRISPR-associated protein Cas2